jgi:ATP-dependent DNA helicase RecQ
LANKLLRDQGSGPTLLVSSLLSLMRNQIDMASKIGIQAFTINSSNRQEWEAAEKCSVRESMRYLADFTRTSEQ